MAFISEKDKQAIISRLLSMEKPVKLVNFTQELECEFCHETRRLLQEISELSDKISLEVYNFQLDKEKVAEYRVDKIPATVVEGEKDYNIRFYGIPSGYEFATLLEDIIMVSKGDPKLKPATVERLKEINSPVHIQVFVTPTCPYCPMAVLLAHKFAMVSDHITADMVEVTEFPHLAVRYGVYGVPKTVINDRISLEGAVPEEVLLAGLLKALEQEK